METVSSNASTFACEKPDSENFDCFELGSEEEPMDVAESFEQLHQSIPWLQKAQVSSETHKGQLKILQAAIDYIIDLEEQLTEHLSDDLYRVAIRHSKAALERSLAAVRRPFADVNAGAHASADEDDTDADVDDLSPTAHSQPQQSSAPMHMQLQPSFLNSGEEPQRQS